MSSQRQSAEPNDQAITPTRRTNVERSESTRSKIIKAAIYCLRHYGYEGASIYAVADHANISKGAAQHQYPNKADLMFAVAEYGLKQQAKFRTQELVKIDAIEGIDWLYAATDITWKLAKKPYYIALIEISMATRNDKTLKKRFAVINKKIDSLYEQGINVVANRLGLEAGEELNGLAQMRNTMLRGLAVGLMYSHNPKGLKEGFESWKQCERLLMENIIANQSDNQQDNHQENQQDNQAGNHLRNPSPNPSKASLQKLVTSL